MLEQPTDLLLVLSTFPDSDSAERVARQLLEEQIIACANVIPGLTSVFRWKGEVRSDPEVLMLLKTSRASLERLVARIPELHPYDVPEVVVIPVEAGLEAYCRWVASETRGALP